MDKYEYRVKTEQMMESMNNKDYKGAKEIADSIDWRRVKNTSMLSTVSEIYEYNGDYQKSRDVLFYAYDRAPGSRKIIYRLGLLALKLGDVEEASDCYDEFVKAAPKDPNQYILKYEILNAQNAPLTDQIAALEDYKSNEYEENWAYELACLYEKAGMTSQCIEACDDLILWFSEGQYVYKAMELKQKYKPLTPVQQEKYDNRFQHAEEETTPTADEILEGEPLPKGAMDADSIVDEVLAQVGEEPAKSPQERELTPEEPTPLAEEEIPEAVPEAEPAEPVTPEEEEPDEGHSSITRVVTGATLEEALRNGMAVANGEDVVPQEDVQADAAPAAEAPVSEEDEELYISGQMKIDEILAEWEETQKANAEAIQQQKEKDDQRIAKEREAARQRREEEKLEVERKAAEAEAARKAAEEEERRKAEEAQRKAEEEAAKKAAEEEATRQRAAATAAATLDDSADLPEDIMELVEQLESQANSSDEAFADEEDEEDLEAFDTEEELELERVEKTEASEGDDARALAEALSTYEEEDEAETSEPEAEEAAEPEIEEPSEPEEAAEPEDESDAIIADVFSELDQADDIEDVLTKEDEADAVDAALADSDDEAEMPDVSEDDFIEGDLEDFEEEDFDEDDFEEEFEEEFEEDFEEDFVETDDLDEDFKDSDFFDDDLSDEDEEEDEDEELEIEEPSEEEIQQRIGKSKGSVPFDTGFVVTGRYDLSATSEIGLKAGLTEDQKKLFSYFVPVRGMSEQIVEVLDEDRRAQREGTSKTGNLMVIGRQGSGKTVLAVDIVKAIQKQRNLKQGKVAIVTGESLNKKELTNIIQKLRGGAIIVEKAGKLNSRTIKELNYLMEKKTGEMLFVMEDQRKPLERIMTANPEFRKKFTMKLELPVFINDELVTFGQTYAKENGYKLDEMGILALYSRIDVMQREDHAVSVAEVKEIMDEAIDHSQKANVKHLARRVFGKSTDDADRIILKEEDFKV